MSWLNLENKVAIVTGGASGIGRDIVRSLSKNGMLVGVFDKNYSKEVEKEFNDNENIEIFTVDISIRNEVVRAVEKVHERFKRIDVLINNAGINIPMLLVDIENPQSQYEINDERLDLIYSINQKGTAIVSQEVSRIMAKQCDGVILNISSESGLEGSEGQSAYAATKAAMNSYTRSWSKELGKYNIRVVGLAPGILEETGLRTLSYEEALAYTRGKTVKELREGYSSVSAISIGRVGRLDEVADAATFLISDRASYIHGVTINIAGGKTRG